MLNAVFSFHSAMRPISPISTVATETAVSGSGKSDVNKQIKFEHSSRLTSRNNLLKHMFLLYKQIWKLPPYTGTAVNTETSIYTHFHIYIYIYIYKGM